MAQSFAAGEKEIWESTIDGRTSFQVENSKGRPQTISVVGKGKRVRITKEERIIIEEGVRLEQNNPFKNGMLVQVGGPRDPSEERSNDELRDEDLGMLFDLKGADFEEAVRSLSEINVRRLKGMVQEKDASKSQSEFIEEHIRETWPIGADTPANAEARGDRTVTV